MCSYSNIGVDGLGFCNDLESKIVERFEGGFATDGSEFRSLEKGVLVINIAHHSG